MKRYGLSERFFGAWVLLRAAIHYLFQPRLVEREMLRALQLRKAARLLLHGEPE